MARSRAPRGQGWSIRSVRCGAVLPTVSAGAPGWGGAGPLAERQSLQPSVRGARLSRGQAGLVGEDNGLHPVALIIDFAGLRLTVVFWYTLTENLRRLDVLKELVAEGSRRWSPSWWLAHGIPILLGGTWIALIAVAIVTA